MAVVKGSKLFTWVSAVRLTRLCSGFKDRSLVTRGCSGGFVRRERKLCGFRKIEILMLQGFSWENVIITLRTNSRRVLVLGPPQPKSRAVAGVNYRVSGVDSSRRVVGNVVENSLRVLLLIFNGEEQ